MAKRRLYIIKDFHVISNGKLSFPNFLSIAQKIHPLISAIHLREKQRSESELKHWVEEMVHNGIPREKIIVNTWTRLANDYQLKGVHLPAHQGNPLAIKQQYSLLKVGVSVHHLNEALYYKKGGADYLFFGNVYETTCKPGLEGKGLNELQRITAAVSIPVIAIGGIQPHHIPELTAASASGIAVMSGVIEAKDPVKAIKNYQSFRMQEKGV